MMDIALHDVDIDKLERLSIYDLRNLGRSIGVPRATTYNRDELIVEIKNQLKSGVTAAHKSVRGRKPRTDTFDLSKLIITEPSYMLSVLDDDDDLYKVRNGEIGTEKRKISGYVHLLPKGGAIVVGIDLFGYNLPVRLLTAKGLKMGDYIEASALFSESRQSYIVNEIFSVQGGVHFDNLDGVRSKNPMRILISAPKGFDRIEDIAARVSPGRSENSEQAGKDKTKQAGGSKTVGNDYNIALLIDENDDSAKYLRTVGVNEVYLAKVNYNLKKQVISCLLCMFRAKQYAEQGKNVILYLDSITKLFKLYNNSAYPEGRIVPGEVALGPLVDLKTFFLSARMLENGGSLTIVAYINKPDKTSENYKVSEYLLSEFGDLANQFIEL